MDSPLTIRNQAEGCALASELVCLSSASLVGLLQAVGAELYLYGIGGARVMELVACG